jgi:hypothetical protein
LSFSGSIFHSKIRTYSHKFEYIGINEPELKIL